MKYLLVVIGIVGLLFAPAWACGGGNCDKDQQQQQKMLSLTSAYNDVQVQDRFEFGTERDASVKIGPVSKPVPVAFVRGQVEEDNFSGERSTAFMVGVDIPITAGTGINSALSTAHQRLIDQNRQMRERHQAEMAEICIDLHQMLEEANIEMSPELKQRCTAFEHVNNDATMEIIRRRFGRGIRHNHQDKSGKENRKQLMTHSRPYQD